MSRRQPLVIALPEDEPAVIKTLRDVLPDLGAWPGVTHAGDTQTIMGLAACGFGVGLGPQDMRTAARPDTWMVDIRPRVALPGLTLAFRSEHRSPSLTALLDVVAQTCLVERSALMRPRRPAAEPDQGQQGRSGSAARSTTGIPRCSRCSPQSAACW